MSTGKPDYRTYVKNLLKKFPYDSAMKAAVGTDFEAVGTLERELLIYLGLKPNDYLIDVGCGAGRLANKLQEYLSGPYLGTDVVPELLDYARSIVKRPDWRFELADGFRIPEEAGRADIVSFFSVFTHLRYEESFCYLEDAKRVCKDNGRIIFSFLELPLHREIFEITVRDVGVNEYPPNIFLSQDTIEMWAEMLGLSVLAILPGSEMVIPLNEPIVFENGARQEGRGNLGQSICVLKK